MKKFPKLKSKALLAPMAGITDVAFRELCQKYGAGLTYTEFVSSAGLIRENRKTKGLIRVSSLEKPSAVQIFGNNIDELLESAKVLEKKFDIIDINFGCPAHKLVKIGAGSEMLRCPEKIGEIVEVLTNEIKKPITVKVRLGIDFKSVNVLEVARVVEVAGASAICVHARTQKQGYSGRADWDLIKKVKKSVGIVVIGNGDVKTPEDFVKRLESGVDYVMIGRGAIGNPYLFKQINDFVKTGKYDFKSRVEQFFEYVVLAKKYKIEFIKVKNHALFFTKGLRGGAKLRKKISVCRDLSSLEALMKSFK